MSQVVIRQATRKDVEGILPLWNDMMDYHAALDARFRPAPDGEGHWAKVLCSWLRDGDCIALGVEKDGFLGSAWHLACGLNLSFTEVSRD